ncbi:hypothetical protein Tco_1122142 [Tanacetum coccineum]|uniref:Uncharacterized protein n=1 Tax=Tanacetum coccineum TaxID=301880 RepID=A0ABQ5IZQ3_9ASTR
MIINLLTRMLKVSWIAWLPTNQKGKKGHDKYAKETVNEWFETEIKKFRRMQQKKDRECMETRRRIQAACLKNWKAKIDVLTKKCQEEGANKVSKHPVSECRAIYANNDSSTKLHEESSMANVKNTQDKEDVSSKILPYLGVSVNVIPKSMFEFLKLTHLKKTEILVEMADMKKKAPIGIVENVLVKIDKFLFPSDFVVIDMLVERNETMILGRPFLATIHAEINVFCDNPSISGRYFILEY